MASIGSRTGAFTEAVSDETEVVVLPSRESLAESAVAAEVENASQARAAALASKNGRSTRQGERDLAMRTTPSTVETSGFYSV
jgi:hypothetical protein